LQQRTDDILGISGKEIIKTNTLPASDEKVKEITDPDYELKKNVIAELEKAEVTTLSAVAKILNVSKLHLWELKRKDPDFADKITQAKEVLADRFEEELLTCDKMAQVVARLARLKTLRPDYRDSFKVVVGSPKVESLLEELKKRGRKPSPRELAEASDGVALLEAGEVNAE
jgi:hypothetical protein